MLASSVLLLMLGFSAIVGLVGLIGLGRAKPLLVAALLAPVGLVATAVLVVRAVTR